MADIVAGHLSMSEATLDATERGLAAMRAAGLSLSQAAYFGDALSSYVTGFVLQEQAMPTGAPEMPEIEAERYPNLVEWQAVSSPDASRAFEAGLSLIVGGMRAALTGET
jgi:TetR/AcrR family transcriptional regulator, tetracycline repressor protein